MKANSMNTSNLLARVRDLGFCVWLASSSACALMSKGDALSPRYFSPHLEAPAGAAQREAQPLDLRIGRIDPAAHVEERIAYRVSDTELAYYDDRRWTEPPEEFVRRALEQELFERRGFQRVISGAAPTLDVEVLSFEELREGEPRARLTLAVTLRDERRALLERTVSVDVPLAGAGGSGKRRENSDDKSGDEAGAGPALAEAMAGALAQATREVADQVSSQLHDAAGSVAARAEPEGESSAAH
jgi:ABC-type uncharacterized transport system auxiliary subunit